MGGGSLMTQLLILAFGIKPVTAVGTDLAYGAITKTVGGWRHWRLRTVDFRLSTWMTIGSIPAAVGGSRRAVGPRARDRERAGRGPPRLRGRRADPQRRGDAREELPRPRRLADRA